MTPAELLQAGRLDEALTGLQEEIRARPEDGRLRVFLFQLNCVLGRLDKALTQLQVVASLDADTMMLARIFQPVIGCELFRREVFGGKRTPLVFGEPMDWVGWLVQANGLVAAGEFGAAAELRGRAFEAAPANPGTVDGKPFAWMADADSRLGPIFELILEGKYYWVPLCRVKRVQFEKPTDLRDLVWLPAEFEWTNGGTATAHVPVRYPGSERSADPQIRLARKTEWQEHPGDTVLGQGQRLLATDTAEIPLLDCRVIEFAQAGQASEEPLT